MSFRIGRQNRGLDSERIRAAATSEGLPPMVGQATQISTALWCNTVAYRGSGAIPPGLYEDIFNGTARPKPVTEKAKSSTIGPQAGRAVLDSRNGRYDLNSSTGKYELRPDIPPRGLDAQPLQLSLRNIAQYLGKKYQLIEGTNPDAAGILRFKQIDHPAEAAQQIVYSVNVNEAKAVSPEVISNYKLIADHFETSGKDLASDSPFKNLNLDSLCTVSATHPGDPAPQIIQVLGGIVRDCDIDYMTDPLHENLVNLLGTTQYKQFLEPIDMSAHIQHSKENNEKDPAIAEAAELDEKMRALSAVNDMVELLMDINKLRWDQYDKIRNSDKVTLGGSSIQAKWEIDYVDKKPFVEREASLEMMSAMVVTVGKGTPLQIYQALEINLIQQKILASTVSASGTRVKIEDLDSSNPAIRNSALSKLHSQPIPYSKEIIARCFIQHPSECHNEFYTSPRTASVLVRGNHISIVDDVAAAKIIQNTGEKVQINPKWISDSPGNKYAETWVAHYLKNADTHYHNESDKNVKIAAENFLKDPKNIKFIIGFQNELAAHPKAILAGKAQLNLDKFLSTNPGVKENMDKFRISRDDPKNTDANVSSNPAVAVRPGVN